MTDAYGVMDFSSLKKENSAAGTSQPLADEVSVSEQDLQGLIDSSQQQLTLLLVTSARVQGGASFVDAVRAAVGRHAGTIRLALVDADQQPRVAAALRVQSLPAAMLMMKGQIQPLFEGAVADDQLQSVMEQLAQLAAQEGMSVGEAPSGAPAAAQLPPELEHATTLLQNGDLAGAQKAFEDYLETHPGDPEAKRGAATTRLMERTREVDLQEGRRAAADAPEDLDAQLLGADLDLLGGHVDDAFGRILDRYAAADAETRDRLRERLLDLFDVVGADDERVGAARRRLARLMF